MNTPFDPTLLTATEWRLASYGPLDPPTPAAAEQTATLRFGSDGRISGSTGCNRLIGSYEAQGDLIHFKPLAMTRMACPNPALQQQEAEISAALQGSLRYELDAGTLRIFYGSDNSMLRYVAAN